MTTAWTHEQHLSLNYSPQYAGGDLTLSISEESSEDDDSSDSSDSEPSSDGGSMHERETEALHCH